MGCVDRYGLPLTGGVDAVAAYNRGVGNLLRLEEGSLHAVAASVALDPTFALGHAALALLGHELCAPVDIDARLRDARLHVRRGTDRERSHVESVARHVAGDSAPLVRHLRRHPTDALLLSVAVPTIAFAGVTTVPQDAWEIVERCAPAYGDDWWFTGLLAFMRQEQGRFDEAMELSCLSLDTEPGAGHSAHARAHAHYETGDHAAAWPGWTAGSPGPAPQVDSLSHFSWHAAMHELSMGDLDAVRAPLRRPAAAGAGHRLPQPGGLRLAAVAVVADAGQQRRARHRRGAGRRRREPAGPPADARSWRCTPPSRCAPPTTPTGWRRWLAGAPGARTSRTPRSPHRWPWRCVGWSSGDPSGAADAIAAVEPRLWRVGGSDAQREVVEETRICALVRAGRYAEALTRHRPAAGPPALPPRRVVPGPGSGDGDLVTLDGRRSSTANGVGAGPACTEPSLMENWLPWHSQVMRPSSTLDTVQPWCVHTAGTP